MPLLGSRARWVWVLTALLVTSVATAEEGGADAPPPVGASAPNPVVVIQTSMGEITAELEATKAPLSTKNFLEYVETGYYEGTVFHRVIGNFMIQGGGMTADLKPKPGQRGPIENEAHNGLRNLRGTVAMARLRAPNTATSQFFINVTDNAFLDHTAKTPQGYGYAVFGKVIDGMDVVDAIKEVPTTNVGMYQDVPEEPVTIEKVTLRETR